MWGCRTSFGIEHIWLRETRALSLSALLKLWQDVGLSCAHFLSVEYFDLALKYQI